MTSREQQGILNMSNSSLPMTDLEPSPVETPTEVEAFENDIENAAVVNPEDLSRDKHPSYFPPTRSTTNTTGISSHSNIPRILLAAQKYSTLGPAAYLFFHYANTAVIPLISYSTATAERTLLLTRPYYQASLVEPLLIFGPIVVHVASGLSLRLYRRFQAAKRYGAETHAERQQITRSLWPKLSLNSALGYALYPMLAAHVIVNRWAPLKVHGDSSSVGLRFFGYGVSRHPILANIGYSILVSVASWHFVGGAAKYLRLTREYVTEGGDYGMAKRRFRERAVNLASGLVALVWALGGLGVIGRGVGAPVPMAFEVKQWDQVYKAVPIVGSMM